MKKKRRILDQINVTPLVDVMMVLMMIFAILGPELNQGRIDIELPTEEAKTLVEENDMFFLDIDFAGKVLLNNKLVKVKDLASFLPQDNRQVIIRADKNVLWQRVAKVLAKCKNSGINKIGLAVQG